LPAHAIPTPLCSAPLKITLPLSLFGASLKGRKSSRRRWLDIPLEVEQLVEAVAQLRAILAPIALLLLVRVRVGVRVRVRVGLGFGLGFGSGTGC